MDTESKQLEAIVSAHREAVYRAPEHRVHQWHAAIDAAAKQEIASQRSAGSRARRRRFGWGAAIPAAVLLGILIGLLSNKPDSDSDTTSTPALTVDSSAFRRGLQYHLRDSQATLASYPANADSVALILDIVAQNRRFEAAAELHNADDIARLLRAFEPVLLQLAANDTASSNAADLRDKLNFEVQVMLTKLLREPSERSTTT